MNESIIALDRVDGLEVVLVAPLTQGFKEQILSEAEQISGLRIVDGMPESVEREAEGAPLTLSYANDGQQQDNAFDLVVVLTKPKILPELASLSKKLEKGIS